MNENELDAEELTDDGNLESEIESTWNSSSMEATPTNGPNKQVFLELLEGDSDSESSAADNVCIDKHETLLSAARNGIVDLARQLINARDMGRTSLDLDCKGTKPSMNNMLTLS